MMSRGPQDEGVRVGRGVVEEPAGGGPEAGDRLLRDPGRLREPAGVEGGLVEGEAGVAQGAVVREEAFDVDAAGGEDAEEAPVAPHRFQEEARGPLRRAGVAGAPQRRAGLGERADGEAVPGGEDLLVAERLGAGGPVGLQRGEGPLQHPVEFHARDPLLAGDRVEVVREVQDVPPLEVAGVAHVVDARQEPRLVRAEQFGDLGRGPDVEGALLVGAVLALRVRVPSRIEGAVRGREVLEDVVQRFFRDRAEVAGAEEVGPGQRPPR